MAQQTAVEWLMSQMLKPDMYKIWPTLLERAKAMEKEQILDSFSSGAWYESQNIEKYANKYYNETYEKNNTLD